MFEQKSRVLLILPQDVLDRARVLAGKATSTLKLPVSLQIVLRALIEEGLKQDGDRDLLNNVAIQAQAVRRIRSRVGQGGGVDEKPRNLRSGTPRRLSGGERKGVGSEEIVGAISRGDAPERMRVAPGKRYDGKR